MHHVVAKGERGQGCGTFPGGAEGRCRSSAAIERPGLVGTLESTVAEAPQDHVLAEAEHHQVGDAVAIDVDGIGTRDIGQVRDRVTQPREREGTANGTVVAIQRRGVGTAGEEEVGFAVGVAVEGGDTATHHVLGTAVVGMGDAGGGRLLDEVGRFHGRRCRRDRDRQRHSQQAGCGGVSER